MSGSLSVTVVKGTNLVVRDFRSSDPYVILKLGGHVATTPVVDKSLNPTWNEKYTFPITNPNRCLLEVEVWDKDRVLGIDWLDPDDFMGTAEIDLSPLLKGDNSRAKREGKVLVSPTKENCLYKDSYIVQHGDGTSVLDVCLKLRKVSSGLVDLKLEWPV